MTGATGFLGHAIARELLLKGHDLVVLSRSPEATRERFPYPAEFHAWDPMKGPPGMESIAGGGPIDAVIHLAGEPVAARRWSAGQKRRILESRVVGTRHLWQGLAAYRAARKASPSVFVSASATGYYGDRGEESLSEAAAPGRGFLADVCVAWEKEAFAPGFDEVRKVAMRLGVVLGRDGGALAKLLPVFSSGLGGSVGGGAQWMSWVHVDDVASAFVEAVENPAYRGPINTVAPESVTNADFARTLGDALAKPAVLPAPALGLKLALGEMASVVLEGQRVRPERLERLGFRFAYPRLEPALRDLCAPGGDPADSVYSAEQWVPQSPETVFPFFSAARNLEEITPPWLSFKIEKAPPGPLGEGSLIDYQLKVHGLPMRWRTRIEGWEPCTRFVDTQLQGPYAKWHHTHTFLPMKGGTLLRDRVLYRLPLGALGKAAAHWKVRRDIDSIFAYRRKRIREVFP